MPISSEHRTADSIFKYLSKESICDFWGSASLLNVSIKSIQQFIAAQILLNFLPFRINEVGRCFIPWDSLSWNLRNLSFKCTNVNSLETFKWEKNLTKYILLIWLYNFSPNKVKKTTRTNLRFWICNFIPWLESQIEFGTCMIWLHVRYGGWIVGLARV